MSSAVAILLVAVTVALACALSGGFLVIRRMAMMSDAIAHSVLPGLIGAYIIARGPNLLAGFIGAAVAGVVTVWLVEALRNSGRVKEDAAIGIVFPALFALGVFVVTRHLSDVHIDVECILFGEIAYVPFERLTVAGADWGPVALYQMGGLIALNLAFLGAFWKELKASTFDPGHARSIGIRPTVFRYALMIVVAVTAVGAFYAVGAILAIALIVVPAATALLLTRSLVGYFALAALIGIIGAWIGFAGAITFDISISGAMATALGLLFTLAALFAPGKGFLALRMKRATQRRVLLKRMIMAHLLRHPAESEFASQQAIVEAFTSEPEETVGLISALLRDGLLKSSSGLLEVTQKGREWLDADRTLLPSISA